jgi:acetyltransferase-like isoleucine patch superfamily enzyme
VVLSGVTIGDNAIVATGAIVSKNSRIGANEVWGGVPAKRLRAGNIAD